jgi:uncharacterized membrane protein YqaE (UPF0057 family)
MKKLTTRVLVLLILIGTITPVTMVSAAEPVPASATVPATSEPDPEAVKAAMSDFKHLSRSERRSRLKDAKKLFKEYRAAKRAGKDAETDQVLLAILAILLPPLAVYLKEGEINSKFWISVILTLIFWIPGVIYALLVVFDAA